MILAGLLTTWVCGAPAFAADFEAGLLAARVGDFLLAAKEWKPLADAGDVRAMVHLGDLHDLGQGIAMDNSEAARLFRAAAEAGYPPGQLRYALSLQIGRGVTRATKGRPSNGCIRRRSRTMQRPSTRLAMRSTQARGWRPTSGKR